MNVPRYRDHSGAADNARLGATAIIALIVVLMLLIAAIIVGVILLLKL